MASRRKSLPPSKNIIGRASPGTTAAGKVGIAVSIADKVDTIAGIFCIGQRPSGAKDPFALRRLALGILRIILEHSLELDLLQLIGSGSECATGADDGRNDP